MTAMMHTNFCLPDTAARAWEEPLVPEEIASKVSYCPIADPSFRRIITRELPDELIDLIDVDHPKIRPMSSIDPRYENIYEGYSKIRTGVYLCLLEMISELPEDIGVAYFEGFRPLYKQKEYFDKKFLEILRVMEDPKRAYLETSKHVYPFIENTPTHCTGAAIDMTLFHMKKVKYGVQNQLLDMGKFGIIYGHNDQQETFSKNTTLEQRKNRLLLLEAATKAGFANYGFEWWHYSYGDKMHAFIYDWRYAVYSLADDPSIPPFTMTEDEYIEDLLSKNRSSLDPKFTHK